LQAKHEQERHASDPSHRVQLQQQHQQEMQALQSRQRQELDAAQKRQEEERKKKG
jgi:hypothetical protein